MGYKKEQAAEATSPFRTFDDDGDLRLEVGKGQAKQTFVVCSRALARASKPFKTMLYGGFAESKHRKLDPDWTITLPEDNPRALATLLNIHHGRFSKIPAVVTRDELFQITILTDKYDMTEILQPWARAWIRPFTPKDYPFSKQGDEVLLWIAWELGHSELFFRAQNHFLNKCSLAKDGALLCPFGTRLKQNDNLVSVGDWDAIGKLRSTLIRKWLACVNETIEKLASAGNMVCKTSSSDSLEAGECRIFYLGALVKSLQSWSYFPVPSASTLTRSLEYIRQTLSLACEGIYPMVRLNGSYSHDTCSPGPALRASIDAITRGLPLSGSLEKHKQKRFSDQAIKSGLKARSN